MAKFCSKCGNLISDPYSSFCSNCGAKLLPYTSFAETIPAREPQIQAPVQERVPKKGVVEGVSSTLKWVMIICGVIVSVIFVTAFIIGFLGAFSSTSMTTDISGISTSTPPPTYMQANPEPTRTQALSAIASPARTQNIAKYVVGDVIDDEDQTHSSCFNHYVVVDYNELNQQYQLAPLVLTGKSQVWKCGCYYSYSSGYFSYSCTSITECHAQWIDKNTVEQQYLFKFGQMSRNQLSECSSL